MNQNARYFLFGGAAGMLVAATLILAARASTERPQPTADRAAAPLAEVSPVALEPVVEPSEVVARTGDRFWGLHLEGVIPCSAMLVRGGGHLVILTRDESPLDKCSYHVKKHKTVTLGDRRFLLTVVGDDTIRAERIEQPEVALLDAVAADVEPEQIPAQP